PSSSTHYPYTTLFRSQLFPEEIQAKQNIQRGDAFGVGEYRLSPEMAYVMDQILRRFLRRPELEKDAFTLVVRGYADAKPVREIRSEEHSSELQSLAYL